MTSYPTPARRRTALVPAVLAAIVLLAASALVGTDGFTWVLYVVSILALIVAVFAWQARQWWWLVVLVPIAVAWNPVVPVQFVDEVWKAMQFVAALVFIVSGILITTENPDDRNRR
ncbi:MAG: hypothetical protein JWL94_1441 [Microbacteriaceae bacterium]|nr:hypothetical protein [Microbacteriaceae bacterium]HEV7955574.1 DUF6804 family protein [Marisediminicola sp.]